MTDASRLKWSTAIRWLIGVVLIWAALGKLANLHEFFTALLAYRLPLPVVVVKVAAVVLPWLELLCGLLLLANHRTHSALAWALFLFVVFTIATAQAWMRGLHIACGCLDLRLIGISPHSGPGRFLESAGFAFFRALVLACAASFVLFRNCSARRPVAP
jgi:uncharacterized membrane protein YphA (DoxX/SURF4 family)